MRIFKKAKNFIKKRIIENCINNYDKQLIDYYVNVGVKNALNFDYYDYKLKVMGFLQNMKCGEFEYKYSSSCTEPNLYSSMFACMTMGLFNEINNLTQEQKDNWAKYFDSFQNEKDGLFYDSRLNNEIYYKTDWWGVRHLSSLILMAYDYLGHKPKYSFAFTEIDKNLFYDKISKTNWNGPIPHSNDIDNYLMNILVMLIYERDIRKNINVNKYIDEIIQFLDGLINEDTGMWGKYNTNIPNELSRMIQFYYHLFPIYLYEKKISKSFNKIIIENTLKTQNALGGFGVQLNSSACEDIDSIYLLINLKKFSPGKKIEINDSLWKVFPWILTNQNEDGGFVFRRNFAFEYGHPQMKANVNESEMFSTWFRTLSIMFIANHLNIQNEFLNNNYFLSLNFSRNRNE